VDVQHTAENSKGKPVIGRPFTTADRRINRRGRPRNFDAFRELAQAIAHETTTDKNGNVITIAERILRSWAESKEPMLQRSFIEYCYGKPPDKIETTGLENKTTLILHYAHEFPDSQQPDGPIIAVDGEGTRRPLLPEAD
jgi:hypothetical protein